MMLGHVCLACKRVYPVCWETPRKCLCGEDRWREAAPKEIRRMIDDLKRLLKKDEA